MSKYNMLSGKVDSILKNGDKIDELTSKQDELKAICSDGISSIKNDLKATFETILSESGSNIQNSEKILKLVDSIDKKLDKGLSLLESIEDTYEDTNIDVSVTKESLNTICEIVTRISKTLNVDFSIPMDELFGTKEETQSDDSTLQKKQEEAPEVPRRRKTKNDPSAKYLNSVQLCDKYNENELAMKLFGKKSITTKEINDLVVKAKFASTFEKGNGLKAIPLGIGSGVVANVDSHLVYVNSEHTDNMLAMLYEKFAGMENK